MIVVVATQRWCWQYGSVGGAAGDGDCSSYNKNDNNGSDDGFTNDMATNKIKLYHLPYMSE
jgi:hypothetical protein